MKKKKVDQAVMLNSRIAVDMLPLTKQIQIASDTAKGAGARLAEIQNPQFEDNEKSFADLYTRIRKTVEFLSNIKPDQIDGSEEKNVVLQFPNLELKFKGIDYLLGFVIPNLGFHVSTAYNIIRHNGVDVGKKDYLGDMPLQ